MVVLPPLWNYICKTLASGAADAACGVAVLLPRADFVVLLPTAVVNRRAPPLAASLVVVINE